MYQILSLYETLKKKFIKKKRLSSTNNISIEIVCTEKPGNILFIPFAGYKHIDFVLWKLSKGIIEQLYSQSFCMILDLVLYKRWISSN